MPDEIQSSAIFRRIAEGDPNALEELVDCYAPLLRGIAQRILHSQDVAEDVLEEAFLTLCNHAARETSAGASPEAALLLTTRVAAVRSLRRSKNLPSHGNPAQALPQAYLPREREMQMVASRQDLVRRLLNQIPASQRKVLDLVLFEGLSEEEIAEVVKEPLGRVKDQVRASLGFARQRLHTLLGTWTADI